MRTSIVRDLPLFPLQTVLFPGMPLRLHVFEPRYQLMIRHCLQRDSTFGVAFIAEGQEARGPLPTPHPIGCLAKISYLEPLGGGRSNLLAIGGDRIRIDRVDRSGPYLTAHASPLRLRAESFDQLDSDGDRLRSQFEGYLSMLADLGIWDQKDIHLPAEPLSLAYAVSAVLQVPSGEKQDLLGINDSRALFETLGQLLRREMALLQSLSERGAERLEESASLN